MSQYNDGPEMGMAGDKEQAQTRNLDDSTTDAEYSSLFVAEISAALEDDTHKGSLCGHRQPEEPRNLQFLAQEALTGAQSSDSSSSEDETIERMKPQTSHIFHSQQKQPEEGAEDTPAHQHRTVSPNASHFHGARAGLARSSEPDQQNQTSGPRRRGRPKKMANPRITPPRPSPGRPKGSKNNAQYKGVGTRRRVSARVAEAATIAAPSPDTVPASSKKGTPRKGIARRVTKPKNKPKRELEPPRLTEDEWEIEAIVDSIIEAGTFEHYYLVKWKGYSSKDNTWEPKSNLKSCRAAIDAFEKTRKSRK